MDNFLPKWTVIIRSNFYFTLKIVSWSEQINESNFDQTGYGALLEQA